MMANKKIKTGNEEEEFEMVKKYLLQCPHVSKDHVAIKAALLAIDKEMQRMERDRKLQAKFSGVSGKISSSTASASDSASACLADSVLVGDDSGTRGTPPPTAEVASDEMMEWQDVEDRDKNEDEANTSYIGKSLAKIAVDAIAANQTTVTEPVAAVAVALHAALRSELLGFSCTGIPETKKASNSGFAAPVRELPNTQFLPHHWDTNPDCVALRYRKAATGALVLEVRTAEESKVTVRLQSVSSKEPSGHFLEFSLSDHFNLDSWNTASKANKFVSPSLHYKGLSQLMTNFCRTFDLGNVADSPAGESATKAPYVDNTVSTANPVKSTSLPIQKSDFVPATPVEVGMEGLRPQRPKWNNEVPTTIGEAFPRVGMMPEGGAFAGDLLPSGLQDPRFLPSNGGRMGGNLMGPNHPMFQGGPGRVDPNSFLPGGPATMQPRFDPIHPMGLDPRNGPGGQPSRSLRGEPNPDHLKPPDSFGSNMFS